LFIHTFFHIQASVIGVFIIQPEDTSFETFLDCADNIHSFVLERENWGSPFLPQPPGCPELVYDGEWLIKGDAGWQCG
jgi:hypothetical protein